MNISTVQETLLGEPSAECKELATLDMATIFCIVLGMATCMWKSTGFASLTWTVGLFC